MSWTISRKVYINGEEVEFASPEELKNKVIAKARELGLARFDVYVNGAKVSPVEFEDVVASTVGDIKIEVVSADKAA